MRRFTRLTNAFSKKLENHRRRLALYFMWYNFAAGFTRPSGCTPAMEAGVADHVWSAEEIARPGQLTPNGVGRERWRTRARRLKRDRPIPRVPGPPRPLVRESRCGWSRGLRLRPVDLIPDFIPVLGYLDDLVVLPLGVLLVRRMIPEAVMTDCRLRAEEPASPGACPSAGWARPSS